jgi:Reverse transcriptase (RNA-dependent DNA polymerase)
LKESNPVETAEYAVANKIADEPAFAWWVRDVLRRRDRIIKKLKTRKVWQESMKFGIDLPRTVQEALEIDRRTGTTFWRDAIAKEMGTVEVAFEFLDGDEPEDYRFIECHMIFDVKMDLTRKARFVAGGHMTDPPKDSTYSSVVSRDSIRLALLIAALNDLDVLACDVQGAYLNAMTKEKIWTICGLEFGAHRHGKKALIVGALYGLKSSGARWREHLAQTLRDFGYQSCKADPDIWMKAKGKPNGDAYWEYVLVYVDDILCISHEPQKFMDMLGDKYTLKAGSVGPPTTYLGAEIRQHRIEGSDEPEKVRWAMSSDAYVKRAVAEVESKLEEIGEKLSTRVQTPLTPDYHPELDQTPELDAKRANYYQGLIGILRWACELGRVDILVDVAKLSRFLAAPREGHLQQVFHIFAYLKRYNHSSMVFDDTIPVHNADLFKVCDWTEMYPGAAESVPPGAPQCRGKSVTTTCYVDADHAGCHVTRRSQSGIIIFVNKAPILWYSKRQNTVETSTFGSEYIAARIAVEMIEGLRYKLRMMGVEVDGPTAVFCDNESVVKNSTHPESTLKKKHNAIAYHRVREAQAAKIVKIAHIDGTKNPADIFTKSLPGTRLRQLIQFILW